MYRFRAEVFQYSFMPVGVFTADTTIFFLCVPGIGVLLFTSPNQILPKIQSIRLSHNGDSCRILNLHNKKRHRCGFPMENILTKPKYILHYFLFTKDEKIRLHKYPSKNIYRQCARASEFEKISNLKQ